MGIRVWVPKPIYQSPKWPEYGTVNNIKNDIKKTWKGIKSIISMKNKSNNDSPTSIIHQGKFIADPLSIANVFNDFFSTVAQKVQSKIKFSRKSFSDFLPPNIHESIILSQITEDEISKIISSLNSSKSTGSNSIPTKISGC